jgi:hypothetical protein
MPWARLDDRINLDAKILALSDPAHRMWTCGLAYCSFNLTDGFIPEHAIHAFGVRALNKAKVACELCTPTVAGKKALWSKVDDGYRVNDYLDWNDSKETVQAARKKAKDRLDKHRSKKRFPRVVNAGYNAICNAVADAFPSPFETPTVQLSTYHVPEEAEEQEHAPDGAKTSLRDVEVRMLRRERSRETPNGKPAVRVIAALARHIIAANPDFDEGELMDAVKRQCARANLEYAGVVGAAIDRARAQLHRRERKAVTA